MPGFYFIWWPITQKNVSCWFDQLDVFLWKWEEKFNGFCEKSKWINWGDLIKALEGVFVARKTSF